MALNTTYNQATTLVGKSTAYSVHRHGDESLGDWRYTWSLVSSFSGETETSLLTESSVLFNTQVSNSTIYIVFKRATGLDEYFILSCSVYQSDECLKTINIYIKVTGDSGSLTCTNPLSCVNCGCLYTNDNRTNDNLNVYQYQYCCNNSIDSVTFSLSNGFFTYANGQAITVPSNQQTITNLINNCATVYVKWLNVNSYLDKDHIISAYAKKGNNYSDLVSLYQYPVPDSVVLNFNLPTLLSYESSGVDLIFTLNNLYRYPVGYKFSIYYKYGIGTSESSLGSWLPVEDYETVNLEVSKTFTIPSPAIGTHSNSDTEYFYLQFKIVGQYDDDTCPNETISSVRQIPLLNCPIELKYGNLQVEVEGCPTVLPSGDLIVDGNLCGNTTYRRVRYGSCAAVLDVNTGISLGNNCYSLYSDISFANTSTTSVTIGTGFKTFISEETNFTYSDLIGTVLTCVPVGAGDYGLENYIKGHVESYNSGTNELVIHVSLSNFAVGSGTFDSWKIINDINDLYPGTFDGGLMGGCIV